MWIKLNKNMTTFIRGKFGRSAAKEIAKKIHLDRIHGKLPNISAAEEKQIVEKTIKEFGADTYKFRERDFQERVLNPLRIRQNDMLSKDEVNSVDKDLGLKEHTNRTKDTDTDDFKQIDD